MDWQRLRRILWNGRTTRAGWLGIAIAGVIGAVVYMLLTGSGGWPPG